MRKELLMVAVIVVVFSLLGALAWSSRDGAPQRDGTPHGSGVSEVDLPDGRTVVCVHIRQGVSCDWGHAR